jgi:hypothetical protein
MIDLEQYEEALFPVTEVAIPMPVTSNGELHLETNYGDDSKFKMIVREDTNAPISVMSADYRLISNRELLEAALPMIDQYGGVIPSPNNNADIEVNRVFGNARSQFAFDFPQREVKVGNDIVHPRITLINSYDGTKRVGFRYGAYRLVCSNGLTIGKASTETYMHIGKNTELNNIEEIIKKVFMNMDSMIEGGFAPMTEMKMLATDINKFVAQFPKQYQDDVTAQLTSTNAWEVYNAGTYVTSHLMDRGNEATHNLERDIFRFVTSKAS